MSESRMSSDLREMFLRVASDTEPRLSENRTVKFKEPQWQGKYADLAHGFYNGLIEDLVAAGLPERSFYGVLLGYRVYAAAIAQVPHALHQLSPNSPKDNFALYDALTQSLEGSLGPVAGVPSHVNVEREKKLFLRNVPVNPEQIGFEFHRTQDGMRYRAKPELIAAVPVEVSEDDLARQGVDYQVAMARKCIMPWKFHQNVWAAMVRTSVFNYQYINADLDALRNDTVATAQ